MSTIDRFAGTFNFLSNFYGCPTPPGISLAFMWEQGLEVMGDRYIYATVEHAYQAAKTFEHAKRHLFAWGLDHQRNISAGEAKKIGKKLLMRPDWDTIKLAVMEGCLRQKFAKGTRLALLLKATHDRALIEGNTWGDRYWGVIKEIDGNLIGENHLGKLLMKIRGEML